MASGTEFLIYCADFHHFPGRTRWREFQQIAVDLAQRGELSPETLHWLSHLADRQASMRSGVGHTSSAVAGAKSSDSNKTPFGLCVTFSRLFHAASNENNVIFVR